MYYMQPGRTCSVSGQPYYTPGLFMFCLYIAAYSWGCRNWHSFTTTTKKKKHTAYVFFFSPIHKQMNEGTLLRTGQIVVPIILFLDIENKKSLVPQQRLSSGVRDNACCCCFSARMASIYIVEWEEQRHLLFIGQMVQNIDLHSYFDRTI